MPQISELHQRAITSKIKHNLTDVHTRTVINGVQQHSYMDAVITEADGNYIMIEFPKVKIKRSFIMIYESSTDTTVRYRLLQGTKTEIPEWALHYRVFIDVTKPNIVYQ